MKRALALAIAAATLVTSTSLAGEPTSVAVVDLQRCLAQTEDGMSAKARLQRLMAARQGDFNRRQKDLVAEEGELKQQQLVLSKAAFQRRYQHWQRRMLEVQNVAMRYQQEMLLTEKNLTAPIVDKLVVVIKRIANERGYDIVVAKATVPFSRSDLDITDIVIQRYNSGGVGGGGGEGDGDGDGDSEPPPAPAPEP